MKTMNLMEKILFDILCHQRALLIKNDRYLNWEETLALAKEQLTVEYTEKR